MTIAYDFDQQAQHVREYKAWGLKQVHHRSSRRAVSVTGLQDSVSGALTVMVCIFCSQGAVVGLSQGL